MAGETDEAGKDVSCMSLLPPRIWRDVASIDPNGSGRDTSCCIMSRDNHSHVLYVRTELLQLHCVCRFVERSERRAVSAAHTDSVGEVCLNWGGCDGC